MSIQSLYCHRCKTEYKVRKEDLNLMQEHFGNFDPNDYRGGCFFKNLGQLKRSQNQSCSVDLFDKDELNKLPMKA